MDFTFPADVVQDIAEDCPCGSPLSPYSFILEDLSFQETVIEVLLRAERFSQRNPASLLSSSLRALIRTTSSSSCIAWSLSHRHPNHERPVLNTHKPSSRQRSTVSSPSFAPPPKSGTPRTAPPWEAWSMWPRCCPIRHRKRSRLSAEP